MRERNPRAHGNPSVLKSKSIWDAGTKNVAIIMLIIGLPLFGLLYLLHVLLFSWDPHQNYLLVLALPILSFVLFINHVVFKGTALSLQHYTTFKFNSTREYKSKYKAYVPNKGLPQPELLIAALAPILPDSRAIAFANCVILVGNSRMSVISDAKRAYIFCYRFEAGVRIRVVKYPLITYWSLRHYLFDVPPPYPKQSGLKLLVRAILPILPDLPRGEAKDTDTIKLD